jgi:hypothetical protein
MRKVRRQKAADDTPASAVSAEAISLTRAMQRLWIDHVVWTRQYVIAAVDDRPEVEVAAARLLKNQEDIGNAIVPFYGKAAGRQLTDLLKQHILIAVDLVAAAKAGDEKRFKTFDRKWDRNAEDIAAFLSNANPHLTKKDVVDLLYLHLSLTKDEAVARLKGDFKKDASVFDQIVTEILTLSDALSNAIVRHFASKFAA